MCVTTSVRGVRGSEAIQWSATALMNPTTPWPHVGALESSKPWERK